MVTSTFNNLLTGLIIFFCLPVNPFPQYYISPELKNCSVINIGVQVVLHVLNDYMMYPVLEHCVSLSKMYEACPESKETKVLTKYSFFNL
jgi:hypothetical protein